MWGEVMEWHYLDERKPLKSGKYLVAAQHISTGKMTLGVNPFITEYSTKTKSFSFDDAMEERNLKPRIYVWCEIPSHPKPKGECSD